MVALAGTLASTGAALTSVTVSVIAASVLVTPSLTRTVKGEARRAGDSRGVQLNTPELPSIEAPVGPLTSENVSVWAGRSASVAVAVNVYAASSGMVALAGTLASTGAALASVTVSVIAASVLVTPSLKRTVNVEAPGPCASVGVPLNT